MHMKQELAEALVAPETYKELDRVHQLFTELRTTAPVALASPKGHEPFWFISKFADVQAIESDNDLFHAGDKATVLVDEVTNQ